MSNDSNPKFDKIIADYLKAEDDGSPPDEDELIAAHPELAESLRDFFANHQRLKATTTEDESETILRGKWKSFVATKHIW